MCLTPINIKNKRMLNSDYAYNTVPCGKCPACRRKRANAWAFRLQQEEKQHKFAHFITLTYETSNLPRTSRGFPTLCKEDVQKWLKRLRKMSRCRTIKYYLAGEYGTNTYRPHYHAIIFDAKPSDIEASWGLGYCHFGTVSAASIAYTVKYLDKGKLIPMHPNDDRLPEFALMSKGMGKNYLTPEMVSYHRANESTAVTLPGGIKQAMPRYYRDKIYPDLPDGSKDPIRCRIIAAQKQAFSDAYERGVVAADGDPAKYVRNMHYAVKSQIEKFNIDNKKRNKI